MTLLLVSWAWAAGYSMDIELVKPFFSSGALPGVDDPSVEGPGAWRLGTMLQWERAPLILYRDKVDVGAVIGGRTTLDLGVSFDANRWLTLEATLPLSVQGQSEVSRLAANGGGAGDLRLGGRAHIYDVGPLRTGAHLDLMLPTNTPDTFRGETLPRGIVGLLGAVKLWRVGLQTDLSFQFRKTLPTDEDYTLGTEMLLNTGLTYDLYRQTVQVWTGVDNRLGFSNFLKGGAENTAELVAGARFRPVSTIRVDAFMGTGLTEGAGATDFRIGTALVYMHPPKPKPKPEPVEAIINIPPPDIVEIPPEPEPEPVVVQWKPTELARVEENQIVIRDPIQFELATDVVLPVSQPTLDSVAKILLEHPEILHVVIEGHASEEGSFLYNYELSLKRANSIWRELVRRGVHPTRLSARAMGEVLPINLGTDEASLAQNRRVVFHIVTWWHPGDPKPVYNNEIKQPWTGDPETIPNLPPLPEPPPPPVEQPKPVEKGKVDPNQFREREEDNEDRPKETP